MRAILSLILVFFLCQSCITIKDSVVDEQKYLGNKLNSPVFYSKKSDGTFLNPFNINTDNWGAGNIERLMLVEFEPLFNYKSVELQVIEKNGTKGALVILYHSSGDQADVYHSLSLELSEEMYKNVLNKTVLTKNNINYQFNEESGKLRASLNMVDRNGNKIEMDIKEQYAEMKPVGLLAPIGGEAKDPKFMTIVFMKHFKFLSQNEPNISLRINDKPAKLGKLPIKANGIKGYQTKYSMEPVTFSWNINYDGELPKIKVPENKIFQQDDIEIELIDNSGHPEIKRFAGIQGKNKVNFLFSPAIPDLQCLSEGAGLKGRFSMRIDEVQGIIAGEYNISKSGDQVTIIIKPTKGYSPVPGKAWMTRLTWNTKLVQEDRTWKMESKWSKK